MNGHITFTLPKTCTACRVVETSEGYEVTLDFDTRSINTSEVETSSEAVRVETHDTHEDREARAKAMNRERQKRYRERQRNANRNARNVTVTQESVTGVTSLIDCESLKEKKINENQTIRQMSVARNVTPVTEVKRNAMVTLQLSLPMVPPIENYPELCTPKICDAWQDYVSWRRSLGYHRISYDGLVEMLEQMKFSMGSPAGEDAVIQLIEYSMKEKLLNVLQPPPPPEPVYNPKPSSEYDAGEDVSPEESAEVEQSIKDFIKRTFRKG